MSDLLPIFPLPNVVLFPSVFLPLHIFEPRYRRLLRDRANRDPAFGVVLTRHGSEVGDETETFEVGTAATVTGILALPDGRADIVVRGGRRFRILASDWRSGYMVASVAWLDEERGEPAQAAALAEQAARAFRRLVHDFGRATNRPLQPPPLPRDPAALAYAIASALPLESWERHDLLAAPTALARLATLVPVLRRERQLLREIGISSACRVLPARFSTN